MKLGHRLSAPAIRVPIPERRMHTATRAAMDLRWPLSNDTLHASMSLQQTNKQTTRVCERRGFLKLGFSTMHSTKLVIVSLQQVTILLSRADRHCVLLGFSSVILCLKSVHLMCSSVGAFQLQEYMMTPLNDEVGRSQREKYAT